MLKENLNDHITTIALATSHPIRQWEDDDFGRRLFRAEKMLEAAGVPEDLIPLLVKRSLVSMTNAYDTTVNSPAAAAEVQESINRRITGINDELCDLANILKLDDHLRRNLDIPL